MMLLPSILAMYTTQEEKDLVADLFEAHSKTMYYAARQILAGHEDAEDAVQEAFIKIHNYLAKLADVASYKTRGYLVIVAKNTAKNMLRKRSRENTAALDEIPYEIPGMDEDIFARVELEALLAEIRSLPEAACEILLLKYHHQCSDKELAEIMNIKYSTVRKRVERARSLLTGRLETA